MAVYSEVNLQHLGNGNVHIKHNSITLYRSCGRNGSRGREQLELREQQEVRELWEVLPDIIWQKMTHDTRKQTVVAIPKEGLAGLAGWGPANPPLDMTLTTE